jgi:hypothetical protein
MDIYWSSDLGETWDVVVEGTADDEEFAWLVPDVESGRCLLMLVAVDERDEVMGLEVMAKPFGIGITVTSVEEELPARFALLPAAPNPFLAGTSLRFDLPEPAKVTLRLFAIDGSLVRTLARNAEYPAGKHAVAFDGRNDRGQRIRSGVYFLRIEAGEDQEAVQKLVRLGG